MKKFLILLSVVIVLGTIAITGLYSMNAYDSSAVDYDTVYDKSEVNVYPVPWAPEFVNLEPEPVKILLDESNIGQSTMVQYRDRVSGNYISEPLDGPNDTVKGDEVYEINDADTYNIVNGDGQFAHKKDIDSHSGAVIVPLGDTDSITEFDPNISQKKVVMLYGDAIILEGKKYDLKVTYSNFLDFADQPSQYPTLTVYNYLFEGFWLRDVSEVTVNYNLIDPETGEEVDENSVAGVSLAMGSINGYDTGGEYISPVTNVGEATYQGDMARETTVTYSTGDTATGIYDVGQLDTEGNGTEDNAVEYPIIGFPTFKVGMLNQSQSMWAIPILIVEEIPSTDIVKSIASESVAQDGIIEEGETITYQLEVSNPGSNDALEVPIRDSIIEDLPSYLTFNDDVVVTGANSTGSLSSKDFVLDAVPANSDPVIITYSVTATSKIDAQNVINIATDNGEMYGPNDELPEGDASSASLATVNTVITKSIIDESIRVDGAIENNEDITYQIEVYNDSESVATNVNVRDSMIESLPEGATIVKEPSSDLESTGSFSNKDFKITTIDPGATAKITYVINFKGIGGTIGQIPNIATDNGKMYGPDDELPEGDASKVTVLVASTNIVKNVIDESIKKDSVISEGEIITYEVIVSNDSQVTAYDVNVRDSMIENLPKGASINEIVTPTFGYSGSLENGDFTVDEIGVGEEVSIVYSVKFSSIDKNTSEYVNYVSDNGEEPSEKTMDNIDYANVALKTEFARPVKAEIGNTGTKYYVGIITVLVVFIGGMAIYKKVRK